MNLCSLRGGHDPSWPSPSSATGGGRLYIMEKNRPRPPDDDKGHFEAFAYAEPDELCLEKVWLRHSLPPPPLVLKPGFDESETARVRSYAVLGGDSHLCVSFSGSGVGTYCFDTGSGEWSRAGDWTLPIFGKAVHVPELNLWFGSGAELCAGQR